MTNSHPEAYWINRGEDVIGAEGPAEADNTRQAAIYQHVANLILGLEVKQVVDIGCNVGQQALFLDRAGYEGKYVGIDSNPHALEIARRNLEGKENYTFEEGNLRWLDIRGYSKECVISKDVLEHMESYDLLRNMLEIARKYVIIASFLPWIQRETQIIRDLEGYYMNYYNENEVIALAKDCSFHLKEKQLINDAAGLPNQVAVFERVKKA